MTLIKKPAILVLIDWFAPGYKAGGPIRSCVNFSHAMSDEYDVWVLTSDTDFGASAPYKKVLTNQWSDFDEGIKVCYLSKNQQNSSFILDKIKEANPDFIYINIIYSKAFSIIPLLLKKTGKLKSKFILCPRGMLNEHGISEKRFKKKAFLNAMKLIGAFKDITFHATSTLEGEDIKKHLGKNHKILDAPNFPFSKINPLKEKHKKANSLSLVYLARIHPIKNLLFFLKILTKFPKRSQLDIFGPIEDQAYWKKCLKEISTEQHDIQYCGEIKHEKVADTLFKYDFMVLPTTGENFGHSIIESFLQGTPVMISDQTPWRNLATQKVGWDVSIKDENGFVGALNAAFEMSNQEYRTYSENSWRLAKSVIEEKSTKEKYRRIFSYD